MGNATAAMARHTEARAFRHKTAGRLGEAIAEYDLAASQWRMVADRCARYGETLISDVMLSEARKNERKSSAVAFEVFS